MKSELRIFLEAVFGGKPDELYALLWTPRDKKSHWFRNVEQAIQFAESEHQRDVYVGVGFSGEDYGAHNRCKSHQIVGIRGLWADLDLRSDAHKKDKLPTTVEEALKLLPEEFPPTFIVLTGNGVHAWWLFREPLIFTIDQERRGAADLAYRWQSLLRLRAAAHGWAFDSLHDLARLLRVPGTQNRKDPKNPKPVGILSQTDHRYNPSDFAEFLDDAAIPAEDEQVRREQAVKLGFADSKIVIDLSATIPNDLLNRSMETDPRFKQTWLRQRDDLKDQSQSGYDMALANFGARNGVSEQQIVDLIVQHRRMHGQQPRTKLNYFQRTIKNAFEEGTMPEFPTGEPAHPSTEAPKSATDRAMLCDQISSILGIRVVRIVKVTGQDPTYRVELATATVLLPGVEHLVTCRKFQLKIASSVDLFIPTFKAGTWSRLVTMMLAALTVEDGGDEANLAGAAKMYVDSYLRETPFIDAEVEQPYQNRYMPAVYEGKIAICAKELRQHINKASGEHCPISQVTAMLSAIGASSVRPKDTKLRDQSRWLLPTAQFPPESYDPRTGEKTDAQP